MGARGWQVEERGEEAEQDSYEGWCATRLDGHGDAVLPHEHLLVVGRRDEAARLLAEGDRVDRGEVLVVDLLHLARVGVVLHDVLVGAARQEDVLLRRVGVDLDAEGDLLVREGRDALARLRVPQLAEAVVRARDEAAAVVGEANVAHGLPVESGRSSPLGRPEAGSWSHGKRPRRSGGAVGSAGAARAL